MFPAEKVSPRYSDMTATTGGLVPTPPNDATKFLNGIGTFTVPAGSGSSTPVYSLNIDDYIGIYGGGGDGKHVRGCSMTSGSAVITAPSGTFTSTAVDGGKLFNAMYPTASNAYNTSAFNSTIVSVTSDTTAILSNAAPDTKTAVVDIMFGSDNTAALAAGKAAVDSSTTANALQLNLGIYLTTNAYILDNSYKGLIGVPGIGYGDFFTDPTPYRNFIFSPGTVLAYVGAYSSTSMCVNMKGATTHDIYGGFISGVVVDGRGMANIPILVQSTVLCRFSDVTAYNPANTTTSVAFANRALTPNAYDYPRTGFSRINGNYRNTYDKVQALGSYNGAGIELGGAANNSYGGTNTCFCTFYELCAHGGPTRDSIRIIDTDDNNFYATIINGGNLRFDSTINNKAVFTNVFYGLLVQSASIVANGGSVQSNAIYGLSGTDNVPVITTTSGAQPIFIDYIGNGAASGLDAYKITQPLKPAMSTLVKLASTDSAYSAAALGTYAGKIAITVDGITKYIPFYS
jgi:hypothetical protein